MLTFCTNLRRNAGHFLLQVSPRVGMSEWQKYFIQGFEREAPRPLALNEDISVFRKEPPCSFLDNIINVCKI